MFGKKNTVSTSSEMVGENKSNSSATGSKDEVYVMPEKFHTQKSGGLSNKVVVLIAIIVLIVAVVVGSYFIYDMWQSNQETDLIINQKSAINSSNENKDNNQNANRNINRNDNGSVNTNTNDNINTNTNTNSNTNDSANNNENNNSNTNLNVNQLVQPTISTDTDRDGLTDLEEMLIGTSVTSPDTDKDGFLDGQELRGGYNPLVDPASGDPFKLEDADFIDRITTDFSADNFTTIYIKGWSVNKIESLHEVRITTATGEMITISVIDNKDSVSAANYYLSSNTQVTLSQLEILEIDNLVGVYAPDGLSAYLTDENKEKIYIFEYDLDEDDEFRYPTIFDMIIRNFELVSIEMRSDNNINNNEDVVDDNTTSTTTSTSTEQ